MESDSVAQAVQFDSAGLSFTEALSVSGNLVVRVLAISVYAVFIHKFYRAFARKDIFTLDLSTFAGAARARLSKLLATVLYIVKYVLVFPIMVFLWFAVLGFLLILLTESASTEHVLLIAISLVGAVRVTAYVSEDLSRDLAKMIPFALLGVFLGDSINFDFDSSLALLFELSIHWQRAGYYFAFVVILEVVLRMTAGVVQLIRPASRGTSPSESAE